MKKIEMPTQETKNFLEVFEMFVISQSAKGVADVTIRNFRWKMRPIPCHWHPLETLGKW